MKLCEFIFRGKSIKTNQFLYGYLVGLGNVSGNEKTYIIPTIKDNTNLTVFWVVHDNTVGFYAQRSDMVRKSIFVGDVVRVTRIGYYDVIANMEVCFGEFEEDGSSGEYGTKTCFGFFLKYISHEPHDWDRDFKVPEHYATMTTKELIELPIIDIKTDNAICFMWATFPNISEALKVMESWGFIYKSVAFTWIKKNKCGSNFWGMGAYTRANAEVCLLGISKNTKAKQQVISHAVHSVIESVIEPHSKKPDIVRDKIVRLLGDIPRIELFARQSADGWDRWGLEAPE